MILTCSACNKSVEIADTAWPGDVVKCTHCGADIHLPKAQTVAYDTSTPLMALSPQGDFRPQTLADDEVLPPGALLGQYRIDKFIGRGGMGSVYRATHTMLQRTVAVKVLPPKFASDPEFVQRFKREALALANLSHPNIVSIHDMGTQGEIYYFVMEYVEGANLRDLLVAKKIPPEEALKIVPQLCEALEYAHSKGIIHRDIKPENIMLDRAGSAKIADFGLAKIVKGEPASTPLTQTNVVMGTLEYMAPEQRDSMKTVDHRADIYSMGVVLYEMLTGELPVGRFEPPSRKVTIDVRVDDVVLKALEREPDRRYQRASHMGTDVSQVRVSRAPVRELPIVDLAQGKAIGTAASRALAVRTRETAVRIDAWDRQEIGLQISGGYVFQGDPQPPVLQARGDTAAIGLYVPKGVEIEVLSREGGVTAIGFRGTLSVRTTDGGFSGNGLEGRISVTTRDGKIAIVGLKGEDIELRSGDGDIEVALLDISRGRATFEATDGDIDVGVAPGASLRYQLHTKDGEIAVPPGGTVADKTGTGTLGDGGASLSARTRDGSIVLRTGVKPSFSAAALRDIWSKLTPKQVEKLGVFAIVSVALLLATPIFGSPIPWLAVTVFWGMAIALDVWKGYVRQHGAQAPAFVPPAFVPPAQPQAAAVPPPVPVCAPPPPAAPPKRMSVLAMFTLLAGIPALLSALAVGIILMTAPFAEEDWFWVTLASLCFASLLTGVVACGFGLSSLHHLWEAKGALYGRAGTVIGTAFGAIALAVPMLKGFPLLDDAREQKRQVQAIGGVVGKSLTDSSPDSMLRLVERDAGFDEARFRAEHAAASAFIAGRGLRAESVCMAVSRERAEVHLRESSARYYGDYLSAWLALKRDPAKDEWRIHNSEAFLKEIRGTR